MPNTVLTDALNEANALAPNDRNTLHTLEISHSGLPAGTLYLVRDRQEWDLTLEDDSTQTFQPVPFDLIPPTADTQGSQELQLVIDNIDPDVPDFIDAIGATNDPVIVKYRPFLSNDTSQPQTSQPYTFYLENIQINAFKVVGRASFTDVINSAYLTQYYTRSRFPSLGN